jgi:two-component system sensor histidine kinase KdpD
MLAVFSVALACFGARDFLDYKIVGYLLLVTVSLLAIFFDIYAVLVAAFLSAVILNFFFIKPYYNFRIHSTEDSMLLLMFFIVALVNGALTYKIRRAKEAARMMEARLNTMKLYNTLLDSLSHELRTPIASIMGAVGTMQDDAGKLSDDNRKRLLCEMEKSSMRLNHQVENLLNMSRLESGYIKPVFDWCDLEELVYKVIDSLSEELVQHKVVVAKNSYMPLFKLDYGLTEQIIYNLLYNAAHYSPPGSEINIAVEYFPTVDFEFPENHRFSCLITVEDNGAGFPEQDIDNAFDKFFRGSNTPTGGTGLGLSIVKGLTEAQNGIITLENKDTGGARFKIYFPAEVMQINEISNE